MYCGKCGAKLSDSARFCGRCGAAIVRKNTSEPIPVQTAAASTPHKVEEAVPPTPAGPAAEAPRLVNTQPIPPRVENFERGNPPSPSAASAKRMQKPILFAAIAALLICIGAPAIYYVLNKGSEDKPSSAASSIVQSQEPPVEEEPASPPSDPPDPPSMDAAYAEVVSNLQAKYGEGFYDDDGPHGVVVVRKIDFDQDGVDELFCAFYNDSYDPYADDFDENPACDQQNCEYCFEVWGWQNEKAVKLTHSKLLGSMSVDAYDVMLEYENECIYLITELGYLGEAFNWAFTVENGEWVCAMFLYYYSEVDWYGEIPSSQEYYMFDTPIDRYEYDRLCNQYFSYEQYQTIPLYYGESQLPETERVIQELQGISQSGGYAERVRVDLDDYYGDWTIESCDTPSSVAHLTLDCRKETMLFCKIDAVFQSKDSPDILFWTGNIYLDFDGVTAYGAYENDGWGNHGSVTLQFDGDSIYLSMTSEGGGAHQLTLSVEQCSRATDYESMTYRGEYNDFHYPSDSQYISNAELFALSQDEIYFIRNEIYARHGYIFQSSALQYYFSYKNWYTPNVFYDDSLLNAIEKANLETITAYEKAMGWRG